LDYLKKSKKELIEEIENLRKTKVLDFEKKYEYLFDNKSNLLYIQKREGKFIDFNKNVVNKYGYKKEEIVGKFSEFLAVPNNDLDKISEYIEKAWNGEKQMFGVETPFIELKIKKKPLTYEIIEIETKSTIIDYKREEAIYLTFHDISYRKKLEKEQLKVLLTEASNNNLKNEIIERKKVEKKLKESLSKKEILLKEVHHRVKNNLQVISSILNLQSAYVKDENTLNILMESQNRIKSMSFIHESLYKTDDFSKINFSEYISTLSKSLVDTYVIYPNTVELDLSLEAVFLNLDLSIPCGLIINELISNAFKYGFIDYKKGKIKINLSENNGLINLIVQDNGLGLPSNINYKKTESLGLQLVITLAEQIDAEVLLDNTKGAKYTIIFKKD